VSDLESELWVNTLFRGRQMAEFLAVKKHLGIQSNTDVLRHLVHKQARALRRLHRLSRPSSSPSPAPAPPALLEPEGQEDAGPPPTLPDAQSPCFSCPLPDCDETDPRCLYQIQQAEARASSSYSADTPCTTGSTRRGSGDDRRTIA
jgi:hypothetical protein